MGGIAQRASRAGTVTVGWLLLAVWTPPTAAQLYPVRHYTVDDGLPSEVVHDIRQGPDGRMWFATRSGIAVYDGRRWQVYNLDDGFEGADQRAVRWDDEGTAWSLSAQQPVRLYRFDEARWQAEPGPATLDPMTVTGFEVVGRGDDAQIAIATETDVLWGRGNQWRTVDLGLGPARVLAIAPFSDGVVVATADSVVAVRDGRPTDARGRAPPGRTILGLVMRAAIDGRDATASPVSILGDGWLATWTGGEIRVRYESIPVPSPSQGVLLAATDGRGGLFVGDHQRLVHHHPAEGSESLGRENGLLDDGVHALFVDRERVLWVAGPQGISKLRGRELGRYGRAEGLFADDVTAILEHSSGTLMLGHPGGLTGLEAGGRRWTTSLGSDRPERVWAFAEDHQGDLWLAAGSLGLGRTRPGPEEPIRWAGVEQGLIGDVTSVAVSDRGELFATSTQGLFRLREANGGRLRFESVGPGGLHVRRAAAFGASLLTATVEGLRRLSLDDGSWQAWTCREAPGCDSVFAALPMRDGSLWVGTANGLYQAGDGDALSPLVEGPTVPGPVYFLTRDREERVWLGTDDGVLVWDGQETRRLTVADGLAGRETYRGAGIVDQYGHVWIGTESGLTVFRERPGPPRPAPVVAVTAVLAEGRTWSASEALELDHRGGHLAFRYRAISFLDEDRIRLRTRLDGFDADWTETASSQSEETRYTNLPPGRYRFSVQAANAEERWSVPSTTAAIVVARPFWRRGWFFLTGLVVGALVFVSSQRLRSQSRYARNLEAQVEQRIAEVVDEKERMTVTLRNIDDGVITTDAEGRIIFLNPTAQALTGWTADAAQRRPLGEVLRVERADGERYDPLGLLEARDLEALERVFGGELVANSGQRRPVEISGSPIVQSRGRHAGLVLAFRDTSERQKMELEIARAQKLEALGLLAGGIAHDFNNLLTVMLGSLAMIDGRGPLEPGQRKLLGDAQGAVLRARDLTRQLLTFSRGGTPVRAAASIAEVVHESASFVLSGSSILADIALADDLWVVEIDAGQISQVLNNLLINATQAMPSGGTVIIRGVNVLGSAVSLPLERYVAISITDHGVGIPEAHLDRIFDPYFSTKEQGRGLGLASAYSIAKQHDGLLAVESEFEAGTTFHLYLPASDARPEPTIDDDPEPTLAGFRVLIMDDDPAVREMVGAVVESRGLEVGFATDGGEAIRAYLAARDTDRAFDAVIMDLTIPGGMGGREAIERLREVAPDVRAIVASGYSNDPVLADHRRYGFVERISKPFKPEELIRVLARALAT